MFVLFNIIFSIAASILDRMFGIEYSIEGSNGGPISSLYALAVFIPGLAVAIRRLHDIGKTGWWILIALIPLVGWVWIIILLATDSNSGDNEYGANPKQLEIE